VFFFSFLGIIFFPTKSHPFGYFLCFSHGKRQ
jgi:hypothetical protein